MKPSLTLIVAVAACTSGTAWAQADSTKARGDSVVVHTAVRLVSFVDAIDSGLGDLPNNLRQVTGELLLAEGEADSYVSLVAVPGARNCIVTRYHSVEDTTASWQAKMFTGGDFGAAA